LINNEDDSGKLKLVKEHHDSPIAGHPGHAKTLELIKRNHQWQGMRQTWTDRFEIAFMPTQQTKEPKNTWMAQTTGSTTTTMERH
jgi:hypothetical protein